MGKKSKHMFRLYSKSKEVDSGSSTSSSESDSDSISDVDRKNLNRHKKSVRSGKIMMKSRRSSSSSDDRKKREEQEHFRKLEAKRNHLKRKLKEAKLKKRRSEASSIKSRSHRTSSSEYQNKLEKYAEYNSIRSRNKEVSDLGKQMRNRECDHRFGSRSPKSHRSHQLNTRETIIIQTSNKDGTPSSRHEKRMRHYEEFKDDLQDCEIERKSVSSKDRAGAIAHCQERQHARRRNVKDKKSYNEKDAYTGISNREESRSDRLLLQTSDRDLASLSVYRDDSTNIGDQIQNKNKCLDMFINKDMYNSGEHFVGREELRRDQTHMCINQRELKSTREQYAPRICDPIRLCDEERDRMFSSHSFEGSPNERSVLVNARDMHERKKHDILDSYKLSHFHEVEHNSNYHNEREREFFLRGNGRECMEFNEVEGLRWNNHWIGQSLHEEGLNNAVPSCSGFVGGPKYHTNEQKNPLPTTKILPCDQHNFQKSKWNMDEFSHNMNVESKIEKSPKYWENRIFDNIKDDRDIQLDKHWTPEWHNNNEIIKRDKPLKLIHPRCDRYGHSYRRNPLELEKRAQTSGFKYHPPSLMNLTIQPPGGYRAGNSRFPLKRNMTYTNPNLATTSTQSNIVVAATTAIAAAKAAAQSVANDMNPSILSHANINSGRQQQPRKATTIVEKTVVTCFEETNKGNGGMPKNDVNIQKTLLTDKNELINGALSEISDSDDEILNNSQRKTTVNIDCKINDVEIKEFEFTMQNKGIDNFDKVVDFEEISDGELEEDIRYKGLGDAVGVDWASLIAETKRQPKIINSEINYTSNGIQNWQACKIICDMGISKRMVEEKYAKHILNTIKENGMDTNNSKNQSEKLFLDYSLLYDKSQIMFNNSEELFWLDCGTIVKDEKNLFNNCALNSRKDLRLRRELCNLSVHEKDASQVPTFGKLNKALILDTFQLAVNAN